MTNRHEEKEELLLATLSGDYEYKAISYKIQ
jgi:hypothetical protein